MADKRWTAQERRAHERYNLSFPIQLEVARPGSRPRKLNGTTINISQGGILARLDKPLKPGTRCRVRFLYAHGRLSPEVALGKVLHSGTWKSGQYSAAIQFDRPLEVLKQPGEL